MEGIITWLNQPLFPDTFIRIWMAIAAGMAVILASVLVFILARRKKKRGGAQMKEFVTEQPEPLPVLEMFNLQGIGNREEQQLSLIHI